MKTVNLPELLVRCDGSFIRAGSTTSSVARSLNGKVATHGLALG